MKECESKSQKIPSRCKILVMLSRGLSENNHKYSNKE